MHAISAEAGVPPETIRSWERRYGFPEPARTASNRRMYSQRDIVAVRWLIGQSRRGDGVQAGILTLRRLFEESQAGTAASTSASAMPVGALAFALETGDTTMASAAWRDLVLLLPPDTLLERVVLPLAMRFARPGHRPLADIRAEAFLVRKAMVLLDTAQPDEGDPAVTILTAGAHGALIPALALGATLARAGYRLAHPVASIDDSETLLMLRDDPPAHLVIVVAPDAPAWLEADLPRAESSHPRSWWPVPATDADNDRWLPHRLGGVIDALR